MYCPECGNKIEDNAVYCPYCGSSVNDMQDCEYNTVTYETRTRSGKWFIAIPVAIIAIIIVVILIASGIMNNNQLMSMAQEDGISPYQFKEDVIKEYGRGNYTEDVTLLSDCNAELTQYCQIDGAGTFAGVYMLTYPETINTAEDNLAESDLSTIILKLAYSANVSVYVNNDFSYYQISVTNGMYGDYDIAYRIIGNTAVFANPYPSYGSGYEILSSLDTSGEYKMNEVDLNNLYNVTDEFIEAVNNGKGIKEVLNTEIEQKKEEEKAAQAEKETEQNTAQESKLSDTNVIAAQRAVTVIDKYLSGDIWSATVAYQELKSAIRTMEPAETTESEALTEKVKYYMEVVLEEINQGHWYNNGADVSKIKEYRDLIAKYAEI